MNKWYAVIDKRYVRDITKEFDVPGSLVHFTAEQHKTAKDCYFYTFQTMLSLDDLMRLNPAWFAKIKEWSISITSQRYYANKKK